MFLFLSKLLPLFIYPLGLATVLTLVAFVLVWKSPKKAAIAIACAFFVLFLSSSAWVSQALVHSLEFQHIPQGILPNADAIVVLGGGIKPKAPPRPSVDLADAGDRIFYGAQLYREHKAPLLVLSGGRIDWKMGGPPESTDMAEIAKLLGVPSSAILEDPSSLNTYQNAVNVRNLLFPRHLKRILLVTSALHMPRSVLIFKRQGFEVIPAPTDFQATQPSSGVKQSTLEETILNFLPDLSRLNNTTNALKEYIGTAVYRLRGWL